MADQKDSPALEAPIAAAPAMRTAEAGWRPLALAYIAFVGFMLGLMGAVSLLGRPEDGSPTVSLQLSAAAPANNERLAVTSFHERRELNGNLIADPALLEDSAEGPLPIIAKDGKMPMAAY